MKKLIILFCALIVSTISNAQNNNVDLNFHAGIVNGSGFWPFYVDGSVNKYLIKNLFIGAGVDYSSINLKPSNSEFTYDRNTFYSFFTLGNQFKISDTRISIVPQLKAGYAFYSYSLNEFAIKRQNDNGFFIAPCLSVGYKLTDRFYINAYAFYNILFNKYENKIDFPVPANYVSNQTKQINDFDLGIGVTYKIMKKEE